MNVETNMLQAVTAKNATYGIVARTVDSRFTNRPLLFLLAFSLLALSVSCVAQGPAASEVAQQASASQATLAIFNDRPMPDGLWQTLITTLRGDLASTSPEIRGLTSETSSHPADQTAAAHADSQVQILRGDLIKPGIQVDSSITVYLIGDCRVAPTSLASVFGQHQPVISGTLGWVKMTDRQIEPFIHVDCERIGQMLGPTGVGRNREQRNQLIATAISRVVLHEWIHIATQNPGHSRQGVTKAQFSVQDLLGQPARPNVVQETGWLSPNPEWSLRISQSPAPNQPSQIRPWGTK
jgi:hypothetical protein